MSIVHNQIFLFFFFSFPIWGIVVSSILSHRFSKSLAGLTMATIIKQLSVIPLFVAFEIVSLGSSSAAAAWPSLFLNFMVILLTLGSITGPIALAIIFHRDNHHDFTPAEFFWRSIVTSFIAITAWFVVAVISIALYGWIGEILKAISLITRQQTYTPYQGVFT